MNFFFKNKIIVSALSVCVAFYSCPNLLHANEETVLSSAFPSGQATISLEEINNQQEKNNEENSSPRLFNFEANTSPLSFASLSSSSTVTNLSKLTTAGYNVNGRPKPLVGYTTLASSESDRFSYRFDIGAAAGSTSDVIVGEQDNEYVDYSSGFTFSAQREQAFGLTELHVVFIDSNGVEIEKTIPLTSTETEHTLILDDLGFDESEVDQIIFRQSYEDIDHLSDDDLQIARRGTINIIISDTVGIPLPIQGEIPNGNLPDQKLQGVTYTGSGFNRNVGTIPGFITTLMDDQGFGFRYDVGGQADSAVSAMLQKNDGFFNLKSIVPIAFKHNGLGKNGKIIFTDSSGHTAEFVFEMEDNYLIFNFDLENNLYHFGDFNRSEVQKIAIEVDRGLSPNRRSQIDFRLLNFQLWDHLGDQQHHQVSNYYQAPLLAG